MAALLTLAGITDNRGGTRSTSSVNNETATEESVDNTASVTSSSAKEFSTLNLLTVSSDCVSNVEARIHALNILRSLFRHSLLGEFVTPYVAQGVIVAIQGFKGKTWAVSSFLYNHLPIINITSACECLKMLVTEEI
jgi:hypothetical protein